MATWKRGQRIVDREFQSALLARVVAYWFAWLLGAAVAAALLHCSELAAGDGGSIAIVLWRSLVPMLLAGVVLFPVALLDAAALSNKLIGSLVRMRRELRQLAAGEDVSPLRFRHGDFWQDCAGELNALRERIASLEAELKQAREAAAEEVGS